MAKELIEMNNKVITDNYIRIDNDHTSFCRRERRQFPNIKDLEKEVKKLRKELREKNVSLYRSGTLKLLREKKFEYSETLDDYHNTFTNLVKAWETKMKDGLYVGYGNDDYYNNVILPLEFKLQKMNRRDCLLDQVKEIELRVLDLKRDLDRGAEFIKVRI